jgi:hypothetical protein
LSVRKQLDHSGISGLTELQQKIYWIIEKHGKVTRQDLLAAIKLKPEGLEQQFGVLRHCELIRALKEGVKVFY